jgi:hypothetical protein
MTRQSELLADLGRLSDPALLIARLEAGGLIRPLPADDRRRPYKLTPAGLAVLRARLENLRAVTRPGQARLGTA